MESNTETLSITIEIPQEGRWLFNFPALVDKVMELIKEGASKEEIAVVMKRHIHEGKFNVYDRILQYIEWGDISKETHQNRIKEILKDKIETHKVWMTDEVTRKWVKDYLIEG